MSPRCVQLRGRRRIALQVPLRESHRADGQARTREGLVADQRDAKRLDSDELG